MIHHSSNLERLFRGSPVEGMVCWCGHRTKNMQYVCLSRRMLSHLLLFKVGVGAAGRLLGNGAETFVLRWISSSESYLFPSIHEKKTRTKLTLIAYLGSALCSSPSFRLKPIFPLQA